MPADPEPFGHIARQVVTQLDPMRRDIPMRLATHPVEAGHCPRCGAVDLLTARVTGAQYRKVLVDLDAADEPAAWAAGRRTWELTRTRRLLQRLPGDPPPSGRVLAEHPCTPLSHDREDR